MDDIRKVSYTIQSIDRTLKVIASEMKRSNDLKVSEKSQATDWKDSTRSQF